MRQIALSMTSAFLILLLTAVADAADVKLDVPDDVIFEKGIEYTNAGEEHLALDLARPKTPQGLSATVTYRLAPKHQFPAAVHDVKAAVRWLRANAAKYGIDPERIGATGDSAGGHLALMLGLTGDVKSLDGKEGGNLEQSSRVSCVVDIYGPSDFTKSYGKSIDAAEVLPVFLGGDLQSARHQHILASPLYWVTPTAAPTLAIHGTQDKYVAFEQAQWLVDRLRAADVEAELLSMEGAGHGFNGEDAKRAQDAMLAFFDKHLKPR